MTVLIRVQAAAGDAVLLRCAEADSAMVSDASPEDDRGMRTFRSTLPVAAQTWRFAIVVRSAAAAVERSIVECCERVEGMRTVLDLGVRCAQASTSVAV